MALADLSSVLRESPDGFRAIGGHMVTALGARWALGAQLYRETGDADLGLPPIVAREHDIASRLTSIGYRQVAANRFARALSDIPAGIAEARRGSPPDAVIDVLVLAYTGRARQNARVSPGVVSTEVPGLATALAWSLMLRTTAWACSPCPATGQCHRDPKPA